MKACKNPTCDRPSRTAYCSETCKAATKTRTGGHQLPDAWVPMSTWWRLVDRADAAGITVRDLISDLIDDLLSSDDACRPSAAPDWDQMSLLDTIERMA